MTFVGGRADMEKALGHALSRHVGYTSGAYYLDRILSVLDCFETAPSVYKSEVVSQLRNRTQNVDEGGTEEYLSEIVHFATALGIVSIVSSREARIQKLAPTNIGRALLGASASEDAGFYQHLMVKVVLLADSDSLVPLLIEENGAGHSFTRFASFQERLRTKRCNWLHSAFPERMLFERIARHIVWLRQTRTSHNSTYTIELFTKNTVRHHVTPRKGWLDFLGLYDRSERTVTRFGSDVCKALMANGEYFWLGPARNVQEALRIPVAHRDETGPFEDELSFAQNPAPPSEAEMSGLILDTADLMLRVFPKIKQIHAPQAPLQLPLEYVLYRQYRDNRSYDWQTTLDEVFRRQKSRLKRLSAKTGKVGFYTTSIAGGS